MDLSTSSFGIRDVLDHNPMVGEPRRGTKRIWTNEPAKPRAILPWDDSPAPEIDYLKINRDFS
jgi:hypothetical protein